LVATLCVANGERGKIPFSLHLRGTAPRDLAIEQFLEMLRFEQRDKVAELVSEAEGVK